jgi:hypothetical protein
MGIFEHLLGSDGHIPSRTFTAPGFEAIVNVREEQGV